MCKHLKLDWKRRVSQLGFAALLGEFSFYGIFRCPFAVPYVSCGNCPVLQCPGRSLWMPVWIGLLVSGLIFGRAFCGWGCPGGLLSELLNKLAPYNVKIRNSVERWSKNLIVIATLIAFFVMNNPRWAIPIRTGTFFNSVLLTWEHANRLWFWRTEFVLAGIAATIIVPHFWCRFLCPTGGLLELLSRISAFNYLKTSACNDCDSCRKSCMAATRPGETNCLNCGDCKSVCPVGAIKFGYKSAKSKSPQVSETLTSMSTHDCER
jgi:ferredoxin-type protein NapH